MRTTLRGSIGTIAVAGVMLAAMSCTDAFAPPAIGVAD